MSVQTKYVRLLPYAHACELILLINTFEPELTTSCSNILSGGIGITLPDNIFPQIEKLIEDYCNKYQLRYEITSEYPKVVESKIIKDIKNSKAQELLQFTKDYRDLCKSKKYTSTEHMFSSKEFKLVFPLLTEEYSYMDIIYSKFNTDLEYKITIPLTC